MYATSRTPIVASTNVSGTARPTVRALPCGLMFAAIDGAISASEMPTASQIAELPPQLPGGGRGLRLADANERVFHAFRHLFPSSS